MLGVVDQSRAYACVSALKETNDDPRVLVWHSPELAELQAEQILSRTGIIHDLKINQLKNLDQDGPIFDL